MVRLEHDGYGFCFMLRCFYSHDIVLIRNVSALGYFHGPNWLECAAHNIHLQLLMRHIYTKKKNDTAKLPLKSQLGHTL